MSINPEILEYVFKEEHEKIPINLWDNDEFVWEAVQWNEYNLKYVSERLKKDKKFIKKILINHGFSFKYIDNNLKKDKKFLLEIIKLNKSIYRYLDKNFLEDEDIISTINTSIKET